jgi:hypothetical protein
MSDVTEILRIHFQNQKADAELMLEMLEKGAPSEQPAEKQREEKKDTRFSPEVNEHCNAEGNSVKPKAFIYDKAVWNRINAELTAQGFKYISDGKNTRWQK